MNKLSIDMLRPHEDAERPSQGGFTLIELLVVMSIIALLATLLVPAMASSATDSAAAKCMSNLRQIAVAWQMYADENLGVFAYNEEGGNPPAWISGNEDYSGNAGDTNVAYLINPVYAQIGPYVKTAALFKCPSDMSLSFGTNGAPRVRSISMSQAIGLASGGVTLGQGPWLPSIYCGGPYQCYFKQSDLGRPSPAGLFVLLEEHPDTINDAAFAFQMPTSPAATTWIDVPAKYHANACNFSFADGHVETHKWQAPQGIPSVTFGGRSNISNILSNPDIWWVGNHTSARADGQPNPFPGGN
jgi:prepilin-type N-terminal cleavage/methylation domain-containing protein/prepilin-type processing-associated H-X9-DG protein